ncbi:MAG TPA: hypothetical protein VGG22_01705 [Candidatus Baltobacteraceae bacterium]
MDNRARRSALSAAGLMLIAGCSGGGHTVGSAPPSGGSGSPSSLANGAKVTLSISLAQKQTLKGRHINSKVRPAIAGKRVPSFVSPSTYSIELSAFYGGASVFNTYVYLNQCANYSAVYSCSTNLPVGTFTIYTSLFDSNNNWLGTNLYSSPSPQTIYANGASPYGNYLYADVAGIAQYVFVAAPLNCTTTQGSGNYAAIYAVDAAGNEIVGPLANPITGYVAAVNGAGLGAVDLYEASTYGLFAADHNTIYDTSLYQLFINEAGPEGAGTLYGSTYNITAYFGSGSNGGAGFQLGSIASPASSTITVGTYIAVAMTPGSPTLNAYDIEESVPAIETCNSISLYPSLSSPSLLGSLEDSSGQYRDILIVDGQNIVMTGSGNPVIYLTGSVPQVAFPITGTYTLGSNETPINLFESPDVTGRFFVITNNSNNSGNGQADQFLATNGATVYSGSYSFQFPATNLLRIAGTGANNIYALYYTNPSGSNLLYGVDRTNGNQYPTITAFTSGSTIFELSPAGPTVDNIFFRGYNAYASTYQLCVFDAQSGFGSNHCVPAGGSNTNQGAVRYETFTGQIMSVEGTSIYGDPANVTPSSFTSATLYTGFPNAEQRFTPGEATAGFIGVYSSVSPYTTTFLQWNGSAWASEGSIQWPNAWVAPLY